MRATYWQRWRGSWSAGLGEAPRVRGWPTSDEGTTVRCGNWRCPLRRLLPVKSGVQNNQLVQGIQGGWKFCIRSDREAEAENAYTVLPLNPTKQPNKNRLHQNILIV